MRPGSVEPAAVEPRAAGCEDPAVRARPGRDGAGWRSGRAALAVAALAVLPGLLFLNAAVSIDAPVFVAVAEQIAAHPLDPFGFEMIWDPTSPRVAEFNHNPPLLSYLLAAVVALVGAWEPALHAVLLPFPVLASLCFLGIVRRLSFGRDAPARAPDAALPAALLVATPAFALLSTTLMLDVPVLAWQLLAVYALLRANEGVGRVAAWEWTAGIAAAAAGLTKYVGFSTLPLLAAGLWLLPAPHAPRRDLGRWLRVLGVPLLVWAGWGAWTAALYGNVHFLGGVALVGQKSFDADDFWNQTLSVPVYYGAALAFPLLVWLERLLRAGRGTGLAVVGVLAGAAVVQFVLPEGHPPRRHPLEIDEAVLAAMGFAGAVVVWGLGLWPDRARWRAPEQRFLGLWLGGFAFFSVFVNWHVNAADALMAAPPAILLWFRQPEARPSRRFTTFAVALCLAFSLLLTASDVRQRDLYRDVAARIAREIGQASGARWFVGHWGLQYYLEREGFRPVVPAQYERRYGRSELVVGDWVVSSRNVSQLDVTRNMARFGLDVVWRWEVPARIPLRATNPDAGAGFYSHHAGYTPFAFGTAPLEEVGLGRVVSARR